MILVDTSGLLAGYDRLDPQHPGAARELERDRPRILSPFVLAEADYMVSRELGPGAARELVADVAAGSFQLEQFDSSDLETVLVVIDRFADLHLGVADASIIALADRHRCYDILTLDQRHFRNVRSLSGRPFRLLPLDAVS